MFITTIPLLVAAFKSTLSTPTPGLPITLRLIALLMIFSVTVTADLTIKQEYSVISVANSSSDRPIFVSYAIPFLSNTSDTALETLSAIKTLFISCTQI